MVDVVTSQLLFNGRRHLTYRFTSVSDGTGESGVLKVDATAAVNGVFLQGNTILPGVHLKILKAVYDCSGMAVRVQWSATPAVDALVLGGFGTMDFRDIGGIQNSLASGANGSILFTTVNASSGDTYSVVLYMSKGIPFGA